MSDDTTTDETTDETVEEAASDETASEGSEDTTEPDDATDESAEDDGADALGDKGKKALDRMKAKWQAEREKRIAAEAKANEGADETDPKVLEALDKANTRIIRSEVKAAAAGKLADPLDAHKFLDLDQFEVDDDGNVDEDEIAEAIDELVKSKPYLAAQGGRRFKGGADGGTRKESRPKQLTRADLAGMSASQINKAHQEGRLQDLTKS